MILLVITQASYSQNDTTGIPKIIDVGQAQFKVLDVVWAGKVVSFSSEYSSKVNSANQVLGKPNVLPTGGSSPCAWTYSKKAKNGDEYIRVSFDKPTKAKQIAIAENYKPGAIVKITLYGANKGEEQVVYQNIPKLSSEQQRILNVFFSETSFEVAEAEISLN